MNKPSNAVLCSQALCKSYGSGAPRLLDNITFTLRAGERAAIVGRSGAGKTTLLSLLGGLDRPDSGDIWLSGHNLATLSEDTRTRLRNRHLGFVYQFHHLLKEFTALENTALPLLVGGVSPKEARQRATLMLENVNLAERLAHYPAQLSGGERQRVAIARALVTQPDCVLLDEPSGNLDAKTAHHIHDLMLNLSEVLKTAFVTVTHDATLAARMDSVYHLEDGQLHRR